MNTQHNWNVVGQFVLIEMKIENKNVCFVQND